MDDRHSRYYYTRTDKEKIDFLLKKTSLLEQLCQVLTTSILNYRIGSEEKAHKYISEIAELTTEFDKTDEIR